MIFICTQFPQLRVYNPATGDYAVFLAGKIELDEGDDNFAVVLAEATRNAAISIMVNETTCAFCGEVFTGKNARLALGSHKKNIHFDIWQKEKEVEAAKVIQREVKTREGFACEVCSPVQVFGTEADLSAHTTLLHTKPPEMDDLGNEIGGGDPDQRRRPGEVDPIPAAAPR